MKFVVALMTVIFAIVGMKLVWMGIRDLVVRLRARKRLVRIDAVILRFEVRESRQHSSRRRKGTFRLGGSAGTIVRYAYPVLSFMHPNGERETFTSPLGELADRNPHAVGQTIPVLGDPQRELQPMLASWVGMWLAPILIFFAGALFTLVAVGIWLIYGDRIVRL